MRIVEVCDLRLELRLWVAESRAGLPVTQELGRCHPARGSDIPEGRRSVV